MANNQVTTILIFYVAICFTAILFFVVKAYIATKEEESKEVEDLRQEIENLKDEREELRQTILLLKQNKGKMPNPDEC